MRPRRADNKHGDITVKFLPRANHRVLALTAAVGAALPVLAQQPGESQAEKEQLETVVVTVQKRSESLSKTPVAVSSFSGKQREETGVLTVADLTNVTPGLSYSTSQDKVYIRGVGRQTNTVGTDPGVAVYTDGFYAPSTVSAAGSPLFIERVEIMRGPQGTLYGRNSIGGAVNVIASPATKKPYAEFRGSLDNFGRKEARASVSGPLTESIQARFNAERIKQTDGYYQNIAGGPDEGGVVNNSYVEGILQGQFEDFDFFLRYGRLERDERGRYSATLGNYDTTSPTIPLGMNPTFGSTVANPANNDIRKFNANTPTSTKLKDHQLLVANATVYFDGFDLKYVGGYHQYVFDQIQDYDNSAVVSYQYRPNGASVPMTMGVDYRRRYIEDRSYFSHELNLVSTKAGPLRWIGGLFFLHEDFNQPVTIDQPSAPEVAAPFYASPFRPAPANPDRLLYDSQARQKSDSYAVFGQVDYDITKTLRATAGLRWSKDVKNATESLHGVIYNPTLGPGVGFYCQANQCTGLAYDYRNDSRSLSGKWSAESGTAGLQWTPDRENMAYAKYRRGFKSGGFNIGSIAPVSQVDSETVDAFEVGYKREVARTFWVNTAVFDYSYRNMQVPLLVLPAGSSSARTDLINLDKVRSQGVEIEANWQAAQGLNLFATYAWLDTKIVNGCCYVNPLDPQALLPGARPVGAATGGARAQDVSGNTLPVAAKHKVSLTPAYRFAAFGGQMLVAGTYAWRSAIKAGIFEDGIARAPSFGQLDGRISFTNGSGKVTVAAFARNMLDKLGYEAVGAAATAAGVATTYSLTPPRTYGLELQVRY